MAWTEEELRQKFTEDPTALDAFSSLRRLFQKEERWEDLAWLYETRAEALSDPQRKADMYFKAGDIYLNKLDSQDRGIEALYRGVLLDPRHRKNARTVVSLLEEKGDKERLREVLRKLVEYYAGQGDKRSQLDYRLRLARLEQEAGNLQEAAAHYKAVVDIDPRRKEALQALASILLDAGEHDRALPLLHKLASEERDPGRRAEYLYRMARIYLDQKRDPVKAEELMVEAERLDPENMEYKTFLIEVYQDKRYPDPDEGGRRAAKLFLDMGRRYLKQGNRDKAKEAFRQAIAIDAYLVEAYSAYATLLEEEEKWEEFAAVLRRGAELYKEMGKTAVHLRLRLARLLITRLGRAEEGYALLEEMLDDSYAFSQVAPELEQYYKETGNVVRLVKLKERLASRLEEELEKVRESLGTGTRKEEKKKGQALAKMQKDLLTLYLELADLYRNELGKPHQAARYIHKALQHDPSNKEARNEYVLHFKEIGDHKRLAETIEYLLKNHSKELTTEEKQRFYVELASLYLKKLGDLERGARVLRALAKYNPDKYQAHYEKAKRKWEQWEAYRTRFEEAIQGTQDPEERLQRMKQLADIMREKGLEISKAISLYSEYLHFHPDDEEVLGALAELLEREGNWEELYRLYERKLQGATPEQAEEILYKLLEIQEEKIGDPQEIRKVAHSLLRLMKEDERAAKAYVRALEELEEWKLLAKALRNLAKIVTSDEEREEILKKAANIYEYNLGDKESALEIWLYLEQEGYGDQSELVPKILSLYEALDRPQDEAEFLARILDSGVWPDDDEEAAALWERLARLYESRLSDPEQAYDAWMRVLQLRPDGKDALINAVRLAYSLERWDDLTDLLQQQIRLTTDPEQKDSLALKLADIYQYRLGDLEEAVGILARLYKKSLDPDLRERLVELYLEIEDPQSALELLSQAAKAAEDKIPYLLRMAEIYLEYLEDLEAATKIYDRILHIDPDNVEVLSSQINLLEEQGEWERVVANIRKIIERIEDEEEILHLTLKAARIYEEELDDPDRAFDWYLRLYEAKPTLENLSMLERVAEGNDGLEERLLVVYRNLLDSYFEEGVYDKALALLEDKGRYQEAFGLVSHLALKYLDVKRLLDDAERLSEEFEGGTDQLVSLFERVINTIHDKIEKAQLLVRLGEIIESRLGDPAGALNRYERAFREDPWREGLLEEIERLAIAAQEWDVLYPVQAIRLARMENPEERVEYLLSMAEVVEEKAGDKIRAFRMYLRVFLLEPSNEEVRDKLWELARQIGEYPDEAKFPRPVEPDMFLKGGLIALKKGVRGAPLGPKSPDVTMELGEGDLEIVEEEVELTTGELEEIDEAEIIEEFTSPVERLALGDLLEARKESTKTGVTQEEILEDYGSDMLENPTAWSGRELPPASSAWEEFARAYAMLPYADEYEHADHLLEIARIWREGAGNLSRTLKTYERAVLVLPQAEDIREDLISLARQLDRVDEAAQVLFTAARRSEETPQLAADLYRLAGQLYEEAGKLAEAEASYREVLAILQHDDEAYEGLRRVYTAREDWEALATLEDWKLKIEDETWPLEEKVNKIKEIAVIFDERLDDADRALEWWWRYIELSEDDEDALRAALRRARQLRAWSKASEALQRLSALTEDDEERKALLKERARILQGELELPDQAIGVWRQVLEMDEHDAEALEALDHLYSQHELLSDLEEILSLRIAVSEGRERVELMKRKAQVLEDLIKDREAAELYEELYRETGEPAFAIKASDLYMEAGEPAKGIRMLKGMLEEGPAKYSTKEQADMWVGLARLQIRALDERDEGMASLERALQLDPHNVSALHLMSELAKEKGDLERYAELQNEIADHAADPSEEVAARFVAAQTWLQLGRKDEAIEALVKVVTRDPEHTEALSELQKLYEERGNWAKAVEIGLRRAQLAYSDEERAALYTHVGKIYLERLEDEERAYQLFAKALQLDPDNVEAISAQADLAEKRGEWENASKLLEAALTKMRDDPKKASILAHRYAKLMMNLERYDDAIVLLQELERRHPTSFFIKLALGEIRYHTKRWREAAKIFSSLTRLSEAEEYPEQLSAALYLAGKCEYEQNKITSAVELWKKAIEANPRNEDALDALVEYYREKGDLEAAVEYLELKGELLPAEKKFDHYLRLGDLYSTQVGREEEALHAYLTALREGGLERVPVEILDRAFEYARLLEMPEEMVEVGDALLSKLTDEDERIPLLIEVGRLAVEHGKQEKARQWLEEAYKRTPLREDIVSNLARIYFEEERYHDVVKLLEDFFQKKIKYDPSLLKYHGLALHRLGQGDRARQVLAEAIEHDPRDVDVLRGLMELVDEDSEEAVTYRRMYLDVEPERVEVIRFLADRASGDERLLYLQALEIVGQVSDEERQLLQNVRKRLADPDLEFKGKLDSEDRKEIIGPQQQVLEPISELFDIVWEAAPTILGSDLGALGLSKDNRVSPVDKSVHGRVYGTVSRALGGRRGALYFSDEYEGVMVIAEAPPLVVMGGSLASASPMELRFLLSRAMELTQPAYLFAAGFARDEFNTFFMGLVRAFHPKYASRSFKASDVIDQRASLLRKKIPIRVAKKLTEFFENHRDLEFSSSLWRKAVWTVAHKVGHVLTGDLGETFNIVYYEETGEQIPQTDSLRLITKRVPELREVLRFHLSQAHLAIREKLGYPSLEELDG